METSDLWPAELRRYVVQNGGALILRPQKMIPGQLFAFATATIVILLGLIGLAFASGERAESAIAIVLGAGLFCLPLSGLLRWTRIEKRVDGWQLSSGMLHWRLTTRSLSNAAIATAMVVKDERGYRYESRAGEHVRIAFESQPFNEAPSTLEVGENFRLPAPELAALRDMFAGSKALK